MAELKEKERANFEDQKRLEKEEQEQVANDCKLAEVLRKDNGLGVYTELAWGTSLLVQEVTPRDSDS